MSGRIDILKSLSYLPSSLALVALIFLFISFATHESLDPFLFTWSGKRLIAMCVIVASIAYLVFSFKRPSFRATNNYLFYLLLVIAVLFEVFLRSFPHLLPDPFLLGLPQDVREEVAEARGHMLYSAITGEDMVYHYQPNLVLPAYPHVEIDALGYRNPPIQQGDSLDIILLGDSMIMALACSNDLGTHFRRAGLRALNLAMGGYGPYHQRDVYHKYIIDKAISHRLVINFVFAGNDFYDAEKYHNSHQSDGKFYDFLGWTSREDTSPWIPWLFLVAKTFPTYLDLITGREVTTINLPYGEITANLAWPTPSLTTESSRWLHTRRALDEITELAHTHGANHLTVLIPSPEALYARYENSLRLQAKNNLDASNLLRNSAQTAKRFYFDASPILAAALDSVFLFTDANDCHFNDTGTEALFLGVSELLNTTQLHRQPRNVPDPHD